MTKKNIIIVFLVMFFLVIFGNKVLADYTCDISIEGDKYELVEGESAIYEIKASNIKAQTGIVMFSTLLDYDSNVFECEIENDDDKNWSKTGIIENLVTMARSDLQANSEDQVIAKMKVTAKTGATLGEKTIKLTQINFVMDDDKSFKIEDQELNLNVVGLDAADNNDQEASTDIGKESTTNNSDNVVLEIFQIVLIAVAVVLIITTAILLIKYKKNN